jgi:hypothetical protein
VPSSSLASLGLPLALAILTQTPVTRADTLAFYPIFCDSDGRCTTETDSISTSALSMTWDLQIPAWDPVRGQLDGFSFSTVPTIVANLLVSQPVSGVLLRVDFDLRTAQDQSLLTFSGVLDGFCSDIGGGRARCGDGNGLLGGGSFSGSDLEPLFQPLQLRMSWQLDAGGAPFEVEGVSVNGLAILGTYRYTAVPEPGSLLLVACGLAGLALLASSAIE